MSGMQRSTATKIGVDDRHAESTVHDEERDEQNGMRAKTTTTTTPVPWRQLMIICLMRLSEPIGYSVIFPFVSDFIWDLGATDDRSSLGMYAGIIESLFAVMITLTVLQWSKASNRYGRRPILLFGLLGSSLSSITFGLSTSFGMLVFARCIAGALNGNVAIYKSVIGEITDRTNVARSLSFLSLMWTVGMCFGPMIGGQLSRPATRFPHIFAHDGVLGCGGVWERFPYFLPCLVAAMINWISFLLGAFYLNESAPVVLAKRRVRHVAVDVTEPQQNGDRVTANEQTPLLSGSGNQRGHSVSPSRQTTSSDEVGAWDLVKIRHIQMVLFSYGSLALTAGSLDAVQVLYYWEPVMVGGLSFPSTISGFFFSLSGVLGVSLQLGTFPYLQRRLGTLPLYRLSLTLLLFVPLIMPWANIVARTGLRSSVEHHPGGFNEDVRQPAQTFSLLVIGFAIVVRQMGSMAFLCNMILVNQSTALAPVGTQIGTLNGLAQMASASMFALGPYFASTLYALTLEHRLLGGYLIWVFLFSTALAARLFTKGIRDVERLIERGEINEETVNGQ